MLKLDHYYLIEGGVLIRLNILVQELILQVETQEITTQWQLLEQIQHIGNMIPHTLPEAF